MMALGNVLLVGGVIVSSVSGGMKQGHFWTVQFLDAMALAAVFAGAALWRMHRS